MNDLQKGCLAGGMLATMIMTIGAYIINKDTYKRGRADGIEQGIAACEILEDFKAIADVVNK